MLKNYNPVRGTYDYMPKDARVRETVKQLILENYQNNGFNLISTPVLENLDFLNMSDGGDNLKLMFKTIKRGDKLNLLKENLNEADLVEEGLRYDLTVPLSRFYSNNKERLPNVFKSIQIDYAFRAERPQKGRNRQFVQCDIDIFGDKSINAELELLKTTLDTFTLLGFNNMTLKINDRRILNGLVLSAGFKEEDINTICVTLDKLDKIAVSGVVMELMEKGLDTACINKLIDIINDVLSTGLNTATNYGVDKTVVDNVNYLIATLNKLTNNQHNIVFDVSIVRGQGYYTGTVFEFYTDGFGGAVGGGGRYDKMVEKITGVTVPAVGVSMGFEPITMLMKEQNKSLNLKNNLALIYDETDDILKVFEAKKQLMSKYNVSLFMRPKNIKTFYDKITEVAECVTTVQDFYAGREIKQLG